MRLSGVVLLIFVVSIVQFAFVDYQYFSSVDLSYVDKGVVNFSKQGVALFQIKWKYNLTKSVSTMPLAYDANNDGCDDIIVISDDGTLFVIDGLEGIPIITKSLGSGIRNTPPLANYRLFSYKGQTLLAVPLINDTLLFLNASNWSTANRINTGSAGAITTPAIVDYDKDGDPEFFFTTTDGKFFGYEYTGESIISKVISSDYLAPVVIADLYGDGNYEAIVGTDGTYLYLFNLSSKTLIWKKYVEGKPVYAPVIGNLDDDTQKEIILAFENRLLVIDSNTSYIEEEMTKGSVISPLLAVDYDFDGYSDIFLAIKDGSTFRIDIYDESLSFLKGLYFSSISTGKLTESCLLLNYDNDYYFDILVSETNNKVILYEPYSDTYYTIEYDEYSGGTYSVPIVSDFDGDRYDELAFITPNGDVYVYDIISSPIVEKVCLLYRQNNGNTGSSEDSDNDNVADILEDLIGTDKNDYDSDDDSIPDGYEILLGLDPLKKDSTSVDNDRDGMADWWELEYGLNPSNPSDNETDLDGDGLINVYEYEHNTNPLDKDTDDDGMDDCFEVVFNLDPLKNDTANDSDGDGMTNIEEYEYNVRRYGRDFMRNFTSYDFDYSRNWSGDGEIGNLTYVLTPEYQGYYFRYIIAYAWGWDDNYIERVILKVKDPNSGSTITILDKDLSAMQPTEYSILEELNFTETVIITIIGRDPDGDVTCGYLFIGALLTKIVMNPTSSDSDMDGFNDTWEIKYKYDPLDPSLPTRSGDYDNDGLKNIEEHRYGTDPENPDTDGDGLPDGWEVEYGLNPLKNDANEDNDGDGLTNKQEYEMGLDPSNPDTDGDIWKDGSDFLPNFNNWIIIGSAIAGAVGVVVIIIWKVKKY